MREIVSRARELFLEGLPLTGLVDRRLSLDLDLFSRGGMRVLDKIAQRNYDVLSRAAGHRESGACDPATGLAGAHRIQGRMKSAVDQSYEYCCRVARSRAKNFYYSFVLLSNQQKNAMCAIYAFMRYCDDLSDEPGAKRAAIDRWRIELDEALEAASAITRYGLRSTTRCAASAFRTSTSTP